MLICLFRFGVGLAYSAIAAISSPVPNCSESMLDKSHRIVCTIAVGSIYFLSALWFLSWETALLCAVALYGNRAVFHQLNEHLTKLRIKLGAKISANLRDSILHRHWLLVAPA